MKTVTFLNHKGGVGKTTFASIIAQGLTLAGYRTLAIDNDSQHNLTSVLGVVPARPDLADVYDSGRKKAEKTFLKSIRKTSLENLHIVSSSPGLSARNLDKASFLRDTISSLNLEKSYDFIIIDNAPGLDLLQEQSILCSDLVFTPTELKQFAVDGVVEMKEIIRKRFSGKHRITKVIPNFYRGTKREKTFLSVLHKMFPGSVTETLIPRDNVLDEIVTKEKILFVHRYASKASKAFISLMQEIFGLDEEFPERIYNSRKEFISEEARERYAENLKKQGQRHEG
ncbi:MAG: ParA family protein [Chitinivibrionales bacterium]